MDDEMIDLKEDDEKSHLLNSFQDDFEAKLAALETELGSLDEESDGKTTDTMAKETKEKVKDPPPSPPPPPVPLPAPTSTSSNLHKSIEDARLSFSKSLESRYVKIAPKPIQKDPVKPFILLTKSVQVDESKESPETTPKIRIKSVKDLCGTSPVKLDMTSKVKSIGNPIEVKTGNINTLSNISIIPPQSEKIVVSATNSGQTKQAVSLLKPIIVPVKTYSKKDKETLPFRMDQLKKVIQVSTTLTTTPTTSTVLLKPSNQTNFIKVIKTPNGFVKLNQLKKATPLNNIIVPPSPNPTSNIVIPSTRPQTSIVVPSTPPTNIVVLPPRPPTSIVIPQTHPPTSIISPSIRPSTSIVIPPPPPPSSSSTKSILKIQRPPIPNANLIQPPKNVPKTLCIVSNHGKKTGNSPSNRRQMLDVLFDKKAKLEDIISTKEKRINVASSSYCNKLKEELEALIKLRTLIRKYEGSSIPVPIFGPSSSVLDEKLKELKIQGLSRVETSANHLRVALHILENHPRDLFCKECQSTFSTIQSFFNHVVNDHENLVSCIYCGDTFCTPLELAEHVKTFQHGFCRECDIPFDDHVSLLVHLRIAHASEQERMSTILLRSSEESPEKLRNKLISHLSMFHLDNTCHTCSTDHFKLTLMSREKLFEHFVANHIALVCKFCPRDEIFCSEREFLSHCELFDHKFCPVCKDLFSTTFLMRCHLNKYHGINQKNPSEKMQENFRPNSILKYIRCPGCGFASTSKASVIQHIRDIVEGSVTKIESLIIQHKRLFCMTCDEIFIDMEEMKEHIKVHKKKLYTEHQQQMKKKKKKKKKKNALVAMDTIPPSAEVILRPSLIKSKALIRYDPFTKRSIYTISKSTLLKEILNKLKTIKEPITCTICGRICGSLEELVSHTSSEHRTFKCTFCNYAAMNESELSKHLNKFHLNKSSVLTLQKKKIPSQKVKKKAFPCEICSTSNVSFDNYRDFCDHVRTTPEHEDMICPACKIVCMSSKTRYKHIKNSHSEYLCPVCEFNGIVVVIVQKQDMEKHLHGKHKENFCRHCTKLKLFSSLELLKKHITSEHRDPPSHEPVDINKCIYICRDKNCSDLNSNRGMFISKENHIYQRHQTLDNDSNSGKEFQPSFCSLCHQGLKYFTYDKLLAHVKQRHGELVMCNHCVDMPIFQYKRDLFLHGKTFGHWNCYKCDYGNILQRPSWTNFQNHLETSHGTFFCWTCEDLSQNISGHRLICQDCRELRCQNQNHKCSLTPKSYPVVPGLTLQKNDKDELCMDILLLHKYLRTSLYDVGSMKIMDFLSTHVKLGAVEISVICRFLKRASNQPISNEALLSLWITLFSFLRTTSHVKLQKVNTEPPLAKRIKLEPLDPEIAHQIQTRTRSRKKGSLKI